MNEYITNKIVSNKTFGNLTMVDLRMLTPDDTLQYYTIIKDALSTIPSALYCGLAEQLALKQAIDDAGGAMLVSDQDAFLAAYIAQAPTRMTDDQVVGNGLMRFAVYNASNVLMGAIVVMRSSIVARVGTEVQVKVTPSFFRSGVRVFNIARTALTAQFTSDQATFYRFLLTNTFDVADSSLTVKVTVVDPHAVNSRYEALSATINYDSALKTAMQGFPDVTIIPALEGARAYSIYGRV